MTETLEPLRRALTFHASFDAGLDADFALGDPALYHAQFPLYAEPGVFPPLSPGAGSPPVAIRKAGKYGQGLAFAGADLRVLCFKAKGNVAYDPDHFQGTASFWLQVDPAAIEPHYSDPFQITDKDYNNDCIWVDFTKNDAPSNFRLGTFGDQTGWDPKNQHNLAEQFFWRLVTVAEPPFSATTWTHVAITWQGINRAGGGRTTLYLDGIVAGKTSLIRERFNWDIGQATVRLGTGPFNGLIDDIAFFDRPLDAKEVLQLRDLEGGVGALKPSR